MSVAHIRENKVSGCGHPCQISPLQASVFKISLACIHIEIQQKLTFGSVFLDFGTTTEFVQQPKYFPGNRRVFFELFYLSSLIRSAVDISHPRQQGNPPASSSAASGTVRSDIFNGLGAGAVGGGDNPCWFLACHRCRSRFC